MCTRTLGLVLVLLCCGGCRSALRAPGCVPRSVPAPADKRLSYCLQEGAGHNCILRDGASAAHIIASSGVSPRLVVAFPAGNDGVAFWAKGDTAVEMKVEGEVASFSRKGEHGVRFHLRVSGPLLLERLLAGSVRTLRDYQHHRNLDHYQGVVARAAARLEGMSPAARQQAARRGVTPAGLRERSGVKVEPSGEAGLLVHKTILSGAHQSRLKLTCDSGCAVTRHGEGWRLGGAGAFLLQVEASTSHPLLSAMSPKDLLQPEVLAHHERLGKVTAPAEEARHQSLVAARRSLAFLSTRRKYMAGSWRFLTYFGRDTLMSLWLLRPVLTPAALEAGLQSVLDNLSPEGMVGHEESLGDQAALERLARFDTLAAAGKTDLALAELARLDSMVMAYHMVDDDLMLAILLEAYLSDPKVSRERAETFLRGTGPGGIPNSDAVARNLDYLLSRAAPYAASGKAVDLVPLHAGRKVGDWRDSMEGLGGGTYAASVNAYLMPAALEALGRMLARGKLPAGTLGALARRMGPKQVAPTGAQGLAAKVAALVKAWDGAAAHFEVKLSPEELRARLEAFIAAAPEGERALLQEQAPASAASRGLTFHAVALNADGSPVEVMHTDDGFALLGRDLSLERLEPQLRKYELTYPLGLYDRFGVYVANPALSSRVADRATFGRGMYHGTVVWSWQQALLQRGLMRQFERLRRDESEPAQALAARLYALLNRIARAEKGVGVLAASELWTVKLGASGSFEPAAYGQAGHATESNALQLWSNVILAVDWERTRLKLAP